jgi:putative aldouronate transport system substrate-binding protein
MADSFDAANDRSTAASLSAHLSRRTFLRASVGATGMTLLLSACAPTPPAAAPTTAPPAPPAPTAAASKPAATVGAPPNPTSAQVAANPTPAGAGPVKVAGVTLPSYIPVNGPAPDLPGAGMLDDGYINFPRTPFKSVLESAGRGGDVQIMTPTFWPPFTPLEQNPSLQEMFRQMNATLKLSISSGSDYVARFNTAMAGSDLPDVFFVASTPNLPELLKARAADLTPYLSGDAVKNYPNLANLLTNTWKGTVFGGGIYGIPSPMGAIGSVMIMNKNRWDEAVGDGVLPRNTDDLTRMLKLLTNERTNQWALGGSLTDPFGLNNGYFQQLYGAPNTWRLEGGKLTNTRETAEYKAGIGYMRDLYAAGLYHPRTLTYDAVGSKSEFINGAFALIQGVFYGNYDDYWNRGITVQPRVNVRLLPVFGHDGKATPTHWLSPFIWPKAALGPGITAFKKADPERIQELLRIYNYLAAPFGSLERLLILYGVEGADYSLDKDGNPIPTDRGPADSVFVPWRLMTHGPDVLYLGNFRDYPTVVQAEQKMLVPFASADPTLGHYSSTEGSKGITANMDFTSGVADIIAGRRPFSDYESVVQAWRTSAGDQIRTEYEQGLAAG